MSWQQKTSSFLGPGELDQFVYYLQNASAEQINKDVYNKTFTHPGIITRSIMHNLLGWLQMMKPINKARLCTAAKIFYLKNKK
jgi:hypothetical protein